MTTPSYDHEAAYDAHIAGPVDLLIAECRAYQIPLLATFAYSSESFCTTVLNTVADAAIDEARGMLEIGTTIDPGRVNVLRRFQKALRDSAVQEFIVPFEQLLVLQSVLTTIRERCEAHDIPYLVVMTLAARGLRHRKYRVDGYATERNTRLHRIQTGLFPPQQES